MLIGFAQCLSQLPYLHRMGVVSVLDQFCHRRKFLGKRVHFGEHDLCSRFVRESVKSIVPRPPPSYVPVMFQGSTSMVVIGADYPNSRGTTRRAEIALCQPGDVLEFRRERGTIEGKRAVGVYSPRGVQIGYAHPGDADELAGMVAVARAVFQTADTWGAVIRVTLDGSTPTLPTPKPRPRYVRPPAEPADEYCDILPARPRVGLDGRRKDQSKISRPTPSPTDVRSISTIAITLDGAYSEQKG